MNVWFNWLKTCVEQYDYEKENTLSEDRRELWVFPTATESTFPNRSIPFFPKHRLLFTLRIFQEIPLCRVVTRVGIEWPLQSVRKPA